MNKSNTLDALVARCRRICRDASRIVGARRVTSDIDEQAAFEAAAASGDVVLKNRLMRDEEAKRLRDTNAANRAFWAKETGR